jgi:DNA-binding transcriptional ArsR family regulator
MKIFDEEIIALVTERLRVLSDPNRLKILHLLQDGERCVTELVGLIGQSQVNISRQLGLLEKAGMVTRRKQGSKAYYSIKHQSILSICDLLCDFLKEEFSHQKRLLKKLEKSSKP